MSKWDNLDSYLHHIYTINTDNEGYLNLEWDPNKAKTNLGKHGVAFEEAQTVFDDPYACLIADPDHSINEERFIILGMSFQVNVLTVCHCLRDSGNSIRIISARKATKNESQQYWRFIK